MSSTSNTPLNNPSRFKDVTKLTRLALTFASLPPILSKYLSCSIIADPAEFLADSTAASTCGILRRIDSRYTDALLPANSCVTKDLVASSRVGYTLAKSTNISYVLLNDPFKSNNCTPARLNVSCFSHSNAPVFAFSCMLLILCDTVFMLVDNLFMFWTISLPPVSIPTTSSKLLPDDFKTAALLLTPSARSPVSTAKLFDTSL